MNTQLDADRLALLGRASLFKGFGEADLRRIAGLCKFITVERGENVLTPEHESRDVFIVLKGRVRIVNFSLSGREVAYATASDGDFFGELSAIDGEARSATVATLERSLFAVLAPEGFTEIMTRYPQVAIMILKKLARIVRVCDERIMDLATLSAYQRVYSEVLKLMKADPVRTNSWLVYPLPTQAQIAAQASTTRETVARVIGQLTHSGLCERKGKTLYIRDPQKLRQLAERLHTEETRETA